MNLVRSKQFMGTLTPIPLSDAKCERKWTKKKSEACAGVLSAIMKNSKHMIMTTFFRIQTPSKPRVQRHGSKANGGSSTPNRVESCGRTVSTDVDIIENNYSMQKNCNEETVEGRKSEK